ncbi:MAG: capsule biosynthesis protein [Desulfovibrionaceae bacterium]|nr:capsule biosynthesis protein [Desulfovibrionaceae bacterium]
MATVVLPTIVIFLYLLFFASPAYISEAKFAVRGQSTATGLEGFSSLFNLSSTSQNDSYIVLSYIMSYDMFLKLDKALHLKEHYSDKKYDWWFRLWQNPTQDDIITFWEWACEVKYDPDTSILVVQVKAFEPDKALAICQEILKNSEELVNNMNIRSRKDAIAKAQQEVERSEERIRKARRDLQAYREKTVILDPGAVATGLYSVVNKLEDSVTQTAAELSEAMTYMNKDSPRVKQLENRLTVLQNQLAQEKKRLAGKVKGNESLSALLSEFQNLSLEEEFAQKQLTSAMTSLEAARVQADAQSQYIEAFERPVLADQSLYPRPALFALLYMVTSLLILGLVSLIVAAIREHAGG